MFNQHLNQLQNVTNTIKNEVNDIETTLEFLLSSTAANSLAMNLKNIQDVLLDTISEVNYGKFNVHLLKPEQLLEELSIISGQLSKELSLPIDNILTELPKIYHLLKVRARMTKEYFIFEVKIPLVSRDNYEVYKLIPIPKKVRTSMVTLLSVSDYAAINLRKDLFIPLSHIEITECVYLDMTTQLCPFQKPISHIKAHERLCSIKQETQLCKTRSEACQDSWVQLHNLNTYLFFCCEPRTLRLICEDQISTIQLNNRGLMKLGNDCVLKVPLPEPETILSGHEKELQDIGTKVNQLKSETGLVSQVSQHDIHHYVAIYLLVGVCGVTAVAYGVRQWRSRGNRHPGVADARDFAGQASPQANPVATDQVTQRGFTNAAFQFNVKDQSVVMRDHSYAFTPDQETSIYSRLRLCVIRHQKTLEAAKELQACFSEPTFAQFTVSLIIICVTAFQMSMMGTDNLVRLLSMGTYLMNMAFQVFIYCYQGTYLSEESSKIASSVYCCPWYMCSVRLRRELLIVMLRTRRITKLTAGGFTTLSLASFMAAIIVDPGIQESVIGLIVINIEARHFECEKKSAPPP
ncbi:unnamed protein product [Arctia plantaginis]|uniref:Odorant receptor n=1 Tax=Arctia plantaginis TaxID=874455 RepID=A0A8S1BV66_ARCPL|nr:unnamed protein product [Arctia plantaginis]